MKMIEIFLEAVSRQKMHWLKYGAEVCDLDLPCSSEQIGLLQSRAFQKLGVPLPEPFIEFLRITDGLTENSVTIYSSESVPFVGETGPDAMFKWDIIEENERIRLDKPESANLVVFGHTDMQAPSYQIKEQRYIWMPLGGIKPDEVFDSFDTMMAATLWLCLTEEFRPDPWKFEMPH